MRRMMEKNPRETKMAIDELYLDNLDEFINDADQIVSIFIEQNNSELMYQPNYKCKCRVPHSDSHTTVTSLQKVMSFPQQHFMLCSLSSISVNI